jgi:hypothetical protein
LVLEFVVYDVLLCDKAPMISFWFNNNSVKVTTKFVLVPITQLSFSLELLNQKI